MDERPWPTSAVPEKFITTPAGADDDKVRRALQLIRENWRLAQALLDLVNTINDDYITSVELAAWAGSTSITTLGTITTGVWGGSVIQDGWIASAATWTAGIAANASAITTLDGRVAAIEGDYITSTELNAWDGSTAVVELGTVTTGTWQATAIDLIRGGLGADVSAYNGAVCITAGSTVCKSLGIANGSLIIVDTADAADNDYAKFTLAGIEGRSYSEVREDLGLNTTTARRYYGTDENGTLGFHEFEQTLSLPSLGPGSANKLLGANWDGTAHEWKTLYSPYTNHVNVYHEPGGIRLYLPQAIGLTSLVQFGGVGCGGPASQYYRLVVNGELVMD